MVKQFVACLCTLVVGIISKGLVVEEVGDLVHHSHPMGPFEITRYPHYEIIKENIKKQEGSLDYTLYINQLPDEAEGSEHLTDLPDELKQLQQQLLEASRVEVHSHEIEVDNSTGWPWYMATIPPGDFYDCLFLYFSCTDYEKPEWPGNKEKCTNLFDYCITYTEKHANSTHPKDPFVTKIPISSEIITTRPKPDSTITIELPSSEKVPAEKPENPAPVSEEPKPSSEEESSETSESSEITEGSSETLGQPTVSSETSSSTLETSENSENSSETPASSESVTSAEATNEEQKPEATQNPTNAPQPTISSEETFTPETESSSDIDEKPESSSESSSSSTTSSSTTPTSENSSEDPGNTDETSQSSEEPDVSETQPQGTEDPQSSTTSAPQASSEGPTSSEPSVSSEEPQGTSSESPETPESSASSQAPPNEEAQNQNSESSPSTESSNETETDAEAQKPEESEPTTKSPPTTSSEAPTPSSEDPTSSSESTTSTESSGDSSAQETSSEKPSSSTVGAENQNALVSGLPTPKPPSSTTPPTSSKPKPPKRPKKKPASCADLYTLKGIRESGTYPILVAGENVTVYCDMETRGGGWTVLQRRGDFGSKEDYFLRKWDAYKLGFGNPEEDHWVGLKFWNNITLSTPQQLLIEMEDWFGNKTEIVVNNFIIGTEFYKFRIIYASIDGEFGESLPKKGTKFSTLDNDNDAWRNNCASRFKGAWWYSACHNSNLNGLYLKGEHESFGNGVNWYHWTGYHYSLKKTEMKVRVQSKAVSLGFLQNKKS